MDSQDYIERDGVKIPLPTPDEQTAFDAWLKAGGDRDPFHPDQHYDLLGAFRAGLKREGKGGHLPDTFKLPGHPTFSVESQYYKPGMAAGKWEGDTYIPIPASKQYEIDQLTEPWR